MDLRSQSASASDNGGLQVFCKTLAVRFRNIDFRSDGCWVWTAAKNTHGYGQLGIHLNGRQKNLKAHRVAYEICYGPIPEGAEIDHLCENRACLNPSHLEAVSHKENLARSRECKDQLEIIRDRRRMGKNYPAAIRSQCLKGKHANCLASKCSCACHHSWRSL